MCYLKKWEFSRYQNNLFSNNPLVLYFCHTIRDVERNFSCGLIYELRNERFKLYNLSANDSKTSKKK